MDKRLITKVFFYGLMLFWATGIIFIGLSALPYHSMSLSESLKFKATVLFPEGWHFFTRNAREPQTRLYIKDHRGNWVADPALPNSKAHNFFGASRAGRARGVEYAMLLGEVPGANWVASELALDDFLADTDSIPIKTVDSPFGTPVMCGEYLFVVQKPVPWAWSPSYDKVNMPITATRLQINCQL